MRLGGRKSSAQDLREDDGIVVLGVAGGVDECERALARSPSELSEPWAFASKFLDVTAAELLEAARLVSEPLPELRAGRQLLIPLIEFGPFA